MSYIEVKNCCKIYHVGDTEVRANDNVNFSIEKGEFVVILGQSGSGKSTILNMLGGLDTVDSGDIIVDGKYINKYNEKQLNEYRRNDIGFVTQFYNLISGLTTKENVELVADIVKNSRDALQVLKDLGLEKRLNNFPSQLSGGEQQRTAIARALVKNPKLLLCDEPTGALDYKTGRQVLNILQDIIKKIDITIVMVTHNTNIKHIANRVIYMLDGKVQNIEVNKNPKNILEIDL